MYSTFVSYILAWEQEMASEKGDTSCEKVRTVVIG